MDIEPGTKFIWNGTPYEVLSPVYDRSRKKDAYWVKSPGGRSIQYGHIIRKGIQK